MAKYIKFPGDLDTPSRWGSQSIPKHTQQTLEDYLIHGYDPGGFVTAMLTNDMYGAVRRSDHLNKTNIMAIADWIINHAPSHSYGSPNAIKAWCMDLDGRRTAYAEPLMKAYTWKALHGEV